MLFTPIITIGVVSKSFLYTSEEKRPTLIAQIFTPTPIVWLWCGINYYFYFIYLGRAHKFLHLHAHRHTPQPQKNIFLRFVISMLNVLTDHA